MKSEFIKLYESLSVLNESKQDRINFVNYMIKVGRSKEAAEAEVQRFDKLKSLLKAPENDYYYWIKEDNYSELIDTLNKIEHEQEIKKLDKSKVAEGAKLVHESEHWKIYHITNFDASQYYGRDSKWCITGVGSYGDTYWRDYTGKGYSFYFLITKQDYNPRGEDSKFAIAINKEAECYQVFNQQDSEVDLDDIPYYTEIKIPGISDLSNYENIEPKFCCRCDEYLYDGDECWGENGELYCRDCWSKYYFSCWDCGEMYTKDQVYAGLDDNEYCYGCWENKFYECPRCYDTIWLDDVHYDENGEGYCSDCWADIQEENEMLDDLESEDY